MSNRGLPSGFLEAVEHASREKWRGFVPQSVKRYSTAASAGAITQVTAAGVTVPLGGQTGLIVALGATTGYEYAHTSDGGAMWIPIAPRSKFRWQPNLSLRVNGTVTGELVLGYYPVCEDTPEEWDRVCALANEFAGNPISPPAAGSIAPGGSATTSALTIKNKSLPGPTDDPQLVPGSGPGVAVFVQIGLDTTTPPGTNDPAAVVCLASSAALASAGAGIICVPGGDFMWPGGPLYVCEIAVIAAGNCTLSVTL